MPALEWCQALQPWPRFWFADSAYAISDSPYKLQSRHRAPATSAVAYGVPFIPRSLEVVHKGSEAVQTSLYDGRILAGQVWTNTGRLPRPSVQGSRQLRGAVQTPS